MPLCALVGYTNAGKSTILNAMLEKYPGKSGIAGRKVFEADMLFATLDTTIRNISVERGREFLLSDTVGFIHKLPTALVEAFKSTLEQVTEADILIQVVDGSDPYAKEHIEVTKETIKEMGAGGIPMITVFNKSDLCDPPVDYPRKGYREEDAAGIRNINIYISAKEDDSLDLLTDTVFEILESKRQKRIFTVPYNKGNVVSYLMDNSNIISTEYSEEGTVLTVMCDESAAMKAEKLLNG